MSDCPNGWHPEAGQLDNVDLAGFRVKVDATFDERLAVTCFCGYPRLGRLVDVAFAADHVTCVSGYFTADDPWDWADHLYPENLPEFGDGDDEA